MDAVEGLSQKEVERRLHSEEQWNRRETKLKARIVEEKQKSKVLARRLDRFTKIRSSSVLKSRLQTKVVHVRCSAPLIVLLQAAAVSGFDYSSSNS